MKKSLDTHAPKPAPTRTASKTTAEPAKTFGDVPAASLVKRAPRVKPAPPLVRSEPAPAGRSLPTVIHAKFDVGFGNALYLRGTGPGLSWDKGVRLDCVSADHWTVSLKASGPVVFKFLINDQIWSTGGDLVAEPGSNENYALSF